MDDSRNRTHPVDQPPISFPVFFELARFDFESQKDIIGRTAALKFFDELALGEVDARLSGVFVQCALEDFFEPGRRRA